MKISTCEECESEYYEKTSKVEEQCPNCTFYIDGYKNCNHQFENGRCIKCYWNGETSAYVRNIIKRTEEHIKKRKSISVNFNIYDQPYFRRPQKPYLTFQTSNKNRTIEIYGDKAGLRLMAKVLLGVAESDVDGYHIHIDDWYNINNEKKEFIVSKEKRGFRDEE